MAARRERRDTFLWVVLISIVGLGNGAQPPALFNGPAVVGGNLDNRDTFLPQQVFFPLLGVRGHVHHTTTRNPRRTPTMPMLGPTLPVDPTAMAQQEKNSLKRPLSCTA